MKTGSNQIRFTSVVAVRSGESPPRHFPWGAYHGRGQPSLRFEMLQERIGFFLRRIRVLRLEGNEGKNIVGLVFMTGGALWNSNRRLFAKGPHDDWILDGSIAHQLASTFRGSETQGCSLFLKQYSRGINVDHNRMHVSSTTISQSSSADS